MFFLLTKEDQYEHNTHNLFFIPPLAPVAALFEYGYLFHPRAKVAVLSKDIPMGKILGASGVSLKDPAGIVIISRDPYTQNILFSEFLAKNSRLIEVVNTTNDLRERSEKVFRAQEESAKFYKSLNTINKSLKRVRPKV